MGREGEFETAAESEGGDGADGGDGDCGEGRECATEVREEDFGSMRSFLR